MKKTPEEIKKGLECCIDGFSCRTTCPYTTPFFNIEKCTQALATDALALIQQLEAELSDAKNNHQHTIDVAERQKDQIDKLKKVIVRLNAERNAAVEDLESYATLKCFACKYYEEELTEVPCNECKILGKGNRDMFEWRGVQKD